ncbi:MAG: hypothetical protein M5U15_04685 [Kiritimatiellae bacterium]|nr:hypothetical protein [Kiritimatiellia bacterium]
MRKILQLSLGLCAGAFLAMPLIATAEEAAAAAKPVGTARVDFSSARVYRGVTLNDGFVAQPSLEAGILPGLKVGVWGNLDIDDFGGRVKDGQFSKIDLYADYTLPINCDLVALTLGYIEHTFPQGVQSRTEGETVVIDGGKDAEREVKLAAAVDAILNPKLAVYYGVDGAIEEDWYVEGGIGHGLALTDDVNLNLGATLAYKNPDEGKSGLSHWTAGAKATYKWVALGVQYIGRIDSDVLPKQRGDARGYDTEVVGTLSLVKNF